jgi:hypothetical protein
LIKENQDGWIKAKIKLEILDRPKIKREPQKPKKRKNYKTRKYNSILKRFAS